MLFFSIFLLHPSTPPSSFGTPHFPQSLYGSLLLSPAPELQGSTHLSHYKSQMWREANNTLASHHNVKQIIDHNIWRVVCTKKQKKKHSGSVFLLYHKSSWRMRSLKCVKNKSWGGTTASGWLSIKFATLAWSHERCADHTPATYSVITVTYSVITVCPFQQRPHMLCHCQLGKLEKERIQKRGIQNSFDAKAKPFLHYHIGLWMIKKASFSGTKLHF